MWRNVKPGDMRNRIASMAERQFRVVTHKRWLAELFQPMGAVIDHGFDIDPATALDTRSGGHRARGLPARTCPVCSSHY